MNTNPVDKGKLVWAMFLGAGILEFVREFNQLSLFSIMLAVLVLGFWAWAVFK